MPHKYSEEGRGGISGVSACTAGELSKAVAVGVLCISICVDHLFDLEAGLKEE